jgi:PAS domain S-box-containing protein
VKESLSSTRNLRHYLSENGTHKSLFDHHPDAIYVMDKYGNYVDSNPSIEKITGYTASEFLHVDIHSFVDGEGLELRKKCFQNCLEGEPQRYECRIIQKNGSPCEVDITYVPIKENEKVIGVYGIAKDLSHYKEMQKTVNESESKYRLMAESMTNLMRKTEKLSTAGELAAGIAHEIRNPLTSIKGFIQLMESTGEGNQKYLRIMNSELNRIELILKELLMLAKPHAYSFQFKDIRTIIKDVITLFENQALLKKIQIATDFDEDLPQLYCAENQLKQTFINFIKNGFEAMPRGGQFTIRAKKEGENVLVSFSDEGCGIPHELLAKLGEPFHTTKENGTGLGVTISYKIVQEHHGTLHFSSEIDVGTTVTMSLPISNQQAP